MLTALTGWMKRWRAPKPPALCRPQLLRVEALEAREVPAALVWTGASGAEWSDSNNWTDTSSGLHRPPVSTDTLYFGAFGGTNTSSVNDLAGLTVAAIVQNNTFTGTITFEAGAQLTVTGTSTVYGGLYIEATANLTSGSIFLYGSLQAIATPAATIAAVVSPLLDMPLGSSTASFSGAGVTILDIDHVTMGSGSSWTVGTVGTPTTTHLFGSIGSSGIVTLVSGSAQIVTDTFTSSAGTVNLNGGTFLIVSGTNTTLLAGTTNVTGNVVINAANVEVNGTGTLNILSPPTGPGAVLNVSGNLNNSGGTISFNNSNGQINVGGNFSQFIGTLMIKVSYLPPAANLINVTGSASLGGHLVIGLSSPKVGVQAFTIIQTGLGVSGAFSSVTYPPGVFGTVNIIGNGVVINM